MARYCLTSEKEASTLEDAYSIALREDYVIASSYAKSMFHDVRPSDSEPMEIDAIEASDTRRPPPPGRNVDRSDRLVTCFRSRNQGYRAADCRAPVVVQVTVSAHNNASHLPLLKTTNTSKREAPYCLEGRHGPPVATRPTSPSVLHGHSNVTTTSDDTRLVIVSLYVADARRPLRALLDSGATNNFCRAPCLSLLPARIHEGPGKVVLKMADGKPHRVPRRELSFRTFMMASAVTTIFWLFR